MEHTLEDLGEKRVLQRLKKYIGTEAPLVRTFSEDCAVIDSGGEQYELLTMDTLVEGTHFHRNTMPSFYIGRKGIKVNISDISSMGGRPSYFMVTLGAPPSTPFRLIDEIYQGLASASGELKIQFAGGNICSSPVIILDILMAGKVSKKHILMRTGSRKGDAIFVTGRLGAAAEGLKLLADGFRLLGDGLILPEGERDSRYVREAIFAQIDPPCLNAVAQELSSWGMLRSMIDLSDGIASDLAEICRESGVGACLELQKIPVAPSVLHWEKKRKLNPVTLALQGGEDYHLLFTVSARKRTAFLERSDKQKIEVFEIGKILDASQGIYAVDSSGSRLELGSGYQHF